jgi:hypothetical protein
MAGTEGEGEAVKFLSSVRRAEVAIIDRATGQGIYYIVPGDLVLFLLWFLSSATAQFLAVVAMAGLNKLYQGSLAGRALAALAIEWLTDWPAWWAGMEVWIEDIRNLGRTGLCLGVS